MDLIEAPLNSYRYHFRRLTWPEEIRLPFSPKEDQRKTILSHALADVSGLKVTVTQALEILKKLPDAIFWRIWIAFGKPARIAALPARNVWGVVGKAHNSVLQEQDHQ